MFSIVDILTISIIIIQLLFLFILFHFEKILTQPRVYLKLALVILILIAISEEMIFLKQFDLLLWLYPFIILGYMLIYPLIYIYSRNLAFLIKDQKSHFGLILIFPFTIFAIVCFIYYPLDYSSKIDFVKHHIWSNNYVSAEYDLFQIILYPAYYLQTIFYLAATIKFISDVRKNICKPSEIILIKYLSLYVVAVFVVEILIYINWSLIKDNLLLNITLEQTISLIFLSACLYVGFKQSMIIVQARIVQYTQPISEITKTDAHYPGSDNANGNNSIEHPNGSRIKKTNLSESEKKEIKAAIENFLNDTKIYLDPNLKLETLSKKIHITPRRISSVINEVYGTNFNHFINEYRISEAIKFISEKHSKVKIEEVFTKAGFNSRSAFNNAFKESTGVSPIEFLRNLTEKQTIEL